MTRVFYGGDPKLSQQARIAGSVEIRPVKTILFSRVPIYDGPTRIYDEATYECLGLINPSTMSYQSPVGENVPPFVPGERVSLTDAAIRNWLATPRRYWLITSGTGARDDILLETPTDGQTCDAANGPMPYRFEIVHILGLQTFVVRWGCRANINPCKKITNDKASGILSHRWRQSRDIDQDGYSTVSTNGHVIFDTGRMLQLKREPDQLFDRICHVLPTNFRRDSIQVTVAEDSSELEYCVIDRETPMALRAEGVSRIEIDHEGVLGREAPEEVLKGVGDIFLDFDITKPFKSLGRLLDAGRSAIPSITHTIRVRLWSAHVKDTKVNLRQIGREIITHLLVSVGFGFVIKAIASYTSAVRQDAAGKFVEVRCKMSLPPLSTLVGLLNSTIVSADDMLWPRMPAIESIRTPPPVSSDILRDEIDDNNSVLGGDRTKGGTRGTFLGQLMAQALTRTCQRQPVPPAMKSIPLPLIIDKEGLP